LKKITVEIFFDNNGDFLENFHKICYEDAFAQSPHFIHPTLNS